MRNLKDLYTENATTIQILKISPAQTGKDKDAIIADNNKRIAELNALIAEEKKKPVSQQNEKMLRAWEEKKQDRLESNKLARQAKVIFKRHRQKLQDEINRQKEIAELLKYTGKNAISK